MNAWLTSPTSDDPTAALLVLIVVTLKATALLAAALAAAWLLRRSSAASRHFVWVCALTSLLVLPLLAAAIPAWHVLPSWPTRNIASSDGIPLQNETTNGAVIDVDAIRDADATDDMVDTLRQRVSANRQTPLAESSTGGQVIAAVSAKSSSLTLGERWASLVLGLWLVITAMLFVRLSLSAARLWRCRRRAVLVESGRLFDEFHRLCRELRLQQPVKLLAGSDDVMPMAWGLRHPCILVPRDIAAWSSEQRRAVLLHELGHVARRDPLSQLVVELARCLYWFHPLVWMAMWRIHVERERACDDFVLNRGVPAGDYARHLLNVVSGGRRIVPALGTGMAGARGLERRLRVILDSSQNRRPLNRRVISLVVVLGLTLALPLAAMRAANSADQKDAASPEVQRTRELIYLLRQYRVASRDEEWARTIRELVEIGKPAVPELVAELDRTDRNSTLRSLGFALRAIGDARAVPALIRAIPKTLAKQGSDFGVVIVDPELRAFMHRHQKHPPKDGDSWVDRGRPVNEIVTALEKLTGHPVPHPGGGKDDDRRERWLDWWKVHQKEYPIDEELRAVARRKPDEDPVEAAGLAKFGPLFSTGPQWRLSPVREIVLENDQYANGKSYFDLDTGRSFESQEGWTPPENFSLENFGALHAAWVIDHQIDVRNGGTLEARDLEAWLIDNVRWETLEEEIRSGESLMLGAEANNMLVPIENGKRDLKSDRIATFLFTTREGGRGIMQVLPAAKGTTARTLRYRLFASADAPLVEPPADRTEPKQKTQFGKIVTAMLPSMVAGAECLLDLETGRTSALPEELEKAFADPRSPFHEADAAKWCREHGIDLVGRANVNEQDREELAEGGAIATNRFPGIQLHGLGMTATRILPKSFYNLTIEETQELLDRWSLPGRSEVQGMSVRFTTPDATESYVIRTADGSIGLLKLEFDPDEPDKIRLRYRLHKGGK